MPRRLVLVADYECETLGKAAPRLLEVFLITFWQLTTKSKA